MKRIRGTTNGETTTDVLIDRGLVQAVESVDLSKPSDLGSSRSCVSPGLFDIQINGYAAVDWNTGDLTPESLELATRQMWSTGVVAFCPTVVTAASDRIESRLAALARAVEVSRNIVGRSVPGFHLEGPFISPEDGPRGAHPAEHVRLPDWNLFERWQDAAGGRIRIVTLAPELPGAIEFIERAAQSGIVVAIGHTAAEPQQIDAAVSAGARLSTHLGNGTDAILRRHPNHIWEQLASDDLWASFIADGHHLPAATLKCFLRCKTIARSLLITDAIAVAGMVPGRYQFNGLDVDLTAARSVCLSGTPYLAGSALEMHQAVGNAVRLGGVSVQEALAMASSNPADLLRCEGLGRLEPGKRANLIVADWNTERQELRIEATIVDGEVVYESDQMKGLHEQP